jgi:hypothetical protein
MSGRCCVFQPFDEDGPFDKRYDDVIDPAIRAAKLEPYRVDRDSGAEIPVDSLHDEIQDCTACLADISADNPNVWYELGYALAAGKPVVMVCAKGRKLPFDIHHRSIIFYTPESPRDFEKLKDEITERLQAQIRKQKEVRGVVAATPVRPTQGLVGCPRVTHHIGRASILYALSNEAARSG